MRNKKNTQIYIEANMKFAIFAILSLCVITVYAKTNAENDDKEMNNLKAKCAALTHVSKSAIERARRGDFQDDNVKEYFHCMLKEGGYMNGNKLNRAKIIAKITKMYGSADAQRVTLNCLSEIANDYRNAVAVAVDFAKCFFASKPDQ